MWVGHLLKSCSSTQQTIALSSGEAELYALAKAATQTECILSMLSDFGFKLNGKVYSDSTAAIGIVYRSGLGKTRHIRVQYLWLQQEIEHGRLCIDKVLGTENIADLMTKSLSKIDMTKILNKMGITFMGGRAEHSLKLQGVQYSDCWMNGSAWTRRHFKYRNCLFTPMKVAQCPKYAKDVGELRVTKGVTQDGKEFIRRDLGIKLPNQHERVEAFTGTTEFVKLSDGQLDDIKGMHEVSCVLLAMSF